MKKQVQYSEEMVIVEKPVSNHRGVIGVDRKRVVKAVALEQIELWEKYLSLKDQGLHEQAEKLAVNHTWKGVKISADQESETGIVTFKEIAHV